MYRQQVKYPSYNGNIQSGRSGSLGGMEAVQF